MTVWEEIVRDYSPAIWKAVYRLVGNPDDAADCVQETFLSAMRHGNSKPIEHWGAFLHRIATARALDCLRKRYHMDTPIFWYRPKDAKKYRVIFADLSVREADTPPNVSQAQSVPAASGPKE